jgi:rod shape-determining protein MreD
MAIDTLRRAAIFVALCLAQALVFNHIHLFGYAMVLIYVYFVVILPRSYPRWANLLWSFFLGLTVDIFSNTPGLAAASLTLTGFLQPYVLEMFLPREAPGNLKSSMAALGTNKFLAMCTLLVSVYCLVFFTLNAFNFYNWVQWIISMVSSTVLTIILMMAIETVRK